MERRMEFLMAVVVVMAKAPREGPTHRRLAGDPCDGTTN